MVVVVLQPAVLTLTLMLVGACIFKSETVPSCEVSILLMRCSKRIFSWTWSNRALGTILVVILFYAGIWLLVAVLTIRYRIFSISVYSKDLRSLPLYR